MKDDVVARLRQMSFQETMKPTTVRIPVSLEKEIRHFCDEENIKLAILVREILELGWNAFNEQRAEEDIPGTA